jgi:uncharacterized membrane protein YkvA (DUF1232 family)
MTIGSTLRDRARSLRRETVALYFAVRDPRTPLMAKIVAGLVVAYALSPIDLIPDWIPVLGYLDDVILVPIGIALSFRLIPEDVLVASRSKAETALAKPKSYAVAVAIVLVWLMGGTVLSVWLYHAFVGA